MMVNEHIPNGYSNWTEYLRKQERSEKVKDFLRTSAMVVFIVMASVACLYIDSMV